MSADGKKPSLRSLVRVAPFTEEDVQSPSPFFRSVAVEPDDGYELVNPKRKVMM